MILLRFRCIPLVLRSLFISLQGLHLTLLSFFTDLNCRDLPLQGILLHLRGLLLALNCILLLLELLDLRLKVLQAKLVFRLLRLHALQSLGMSLRFQLTTFFLLFNLSCELRLDLLALSVICTRSVNECILLYL